jgi:hypothetical protein
MLSVEAVCGKEIVRAWRGMGLCGTVTDVVSSGPWDDLAANLVQADSAPYAK